MSDNSVNLTERQVKGNWALYLPAISSFFVKQMGRTYNDPNYVPANRIPQGFEKGLDGLDYFNNSNGYFSYNYGLYSAGHALLDLSKAPIREPLIHNRNRNNTILLGDSAGFQIATGVLKVDWATFPTPAGDALRQDILNWLEATSDWSMTLDVPAPAAEAPLNKKTGLKKFQDTLDISEYNLHYFMKHRIPGKTKFLNVLSGSSAENARIWYDTVKHFSNPKTVTEMGYSPDKTLEGYAFAGINMRNMAVVLERLLQLRADNLLKGKDWIHFLGIGRLDWSCFLTSIRRQLQKYDNPNINISFDAASPFVSTAYGLAYQANSFTPKKFGYSMDKALDDRKFKGSQLAMPWQGPIMERLVAGDICPMGATCLNKRGQISRSSWDTVSYLLYMSHNVYMHISAVQEANRLADIEHKRYTVDYRDWSKQKKSASGQDISLFVPNTVLFFEDFVSKLLDPSNSEPMQMIDDNRGFLENISFGKYQTNAFNDMFDVEHIIPTEDELVDANDEKLVELEDSVK